MYDLHLILGAIDVLLQYNFSILNFYTNYAGVSFVLIT